MKKSTTKATKKTRKTAASSIKVGGKDTKLKSKPAPYKPSKKTPSDLTVFYGVALVRRGKEGRETLIVSDLHTAGLLGLDAAEMRVVQAGLRAQANVTGTCQRQKQGGGIRCLAGTCSGACHLFRAKRPIDPENPKIEDLGETGRTYVQMEEGYGYWCDCV